MIRSSRNPDRRPAAPAAAILAVALAFAAPCAGAVTLAADWAESGAVDPVAAYGETIRFQVLRNGDAVGEHVVRFERQDEDLIVRSRFNLEVKVMFITAYRYEYASTDIWRDGQLVSLAATINDDGKRTTVNARVAGEGLQIEGPKGAQSAALGLFPTSHWHPGVLSQSEVLNTITGDVNQVAIVDRGVDEVQINGGRQPARHFAYTGELETEVWYDARGRWVKMRFNAKDGSTIDYICTSCQS